MSIVFDVDGVLLDFNYSFAKWWNKQSPHKCSVNPARWGFHEHVSNDAINTFIDEKHILPLVCEEAPAAIKELRKHYRIILVTAYPHRHARIQNLQIHGIEWDELHICRRHDKLEKLLAIKNKIAVFEDCPETIEEYSDNGIEVMVPNWGYDLPFAAAAGIKMYNRHELGQFLTENYL